MRDPGTEQYLEKGIYAWKYRERVEFRQIDLEASLQNPARILRRLDQDKAIEYGMAMVAGDEFPALLLLNLENPHDGFEYLVATGCHRIEGAQKLAEKYWFDAYVVTEADHYRRELLVRQANQRVGKGMDHHEILEHILFLHETYGKSLTQLAKEWHQSLSSVQTASAERKARSRARRFGFDFDRFKVSLKAAVAINTIHSDIVFKEAAALLIAQNVLNAGEIREMVQEIKKARDEKSQVDVVERYHDIAEERLAKQRATRGRVKPVAINRIMSLIKQVNKQLLVPFDDLHVSALEDRPHHIIVIEELMKSLKRLKEEIDRVDRLSRPPSPELRKGEAPGPEARV